jgi:predicted RNA binding protein YcfA (HicA-like mRNA interferase family)
MPRQARLRARQLIAALLRTGIIVVRSRGSRHFLRHPDGRAMVVPVHAGETIGPGLLARILRDAAMDVQQLERHL